MASRLHGTDLHLTEGSRKSRKRMLVLHVPQIQLSSNLFSLKNLTTEQPWRVGLGRDGLEWVQKGEGKQRQEKYDEKMSMSKIFRRRLSCLISLIQQSHPMQSSLTIVSSFFSDLTYHYQPGTKATICGVSFNVLVVFSVHLLH